MIAYKLTDENMQTYNEYQWAIGEKKIVSGEGELCGPGWLHFYTDPRLAVILNPIHAAIPNPRLFEVEVGGKFKDDRGLKVGYTEAVLIQEIPLSKISLEQKIEFAIHVALEVYTESKFVEWSNKWLNEEDRSKESAYAAAYAASNAVYTASNAAAYTASNAAAYAASNAAAYAASNVVANAVVNAAYAAAFDAKQIDFVGILDKIMNKE